MFRGTKIYTWKSKVPSKAKALLHLKVYPVLKIDTTVHGGQELCGFNPK